MDREVYRLRRLNLDRLVKLAQVGDNKAMGMVLVKLEPMVKSIISKYYGTWADFEDFLQVGFVGVMQAVYNYNDSSNTKFTTFAYLNISSEIKSFITYLNRQKNKVLSEALSIENTFEDSNDDAESFFEQPCEQDMSKSILIRYLIEQEVSLMQDYERVIIYDWFDGFSYKEIAEKHSIAFKKVDNTIQKIKGLLSKKTDLIERIDDFLGGKI